MIWILRLLVAFFLTAVTTHALSAITVTGLELVSSKRVGRTVFEYTYKAKINNSSNEARTGVTATVISATPATTVVRGAFAVGDVGALASRTSSGAFIVRHDRVAPFALNQLTFTFDAQIGRDVVFSGPPPLPLDAIAALPISPDSGLPELIRLPEGGLELDVNQRDAITDVGQCTGWITACVTPGARSLDDCVRSVPACAAGTAVGGAVACCPSACAADYKQARLSGASDMDAFMNTYFNDGSCVPGFTGLNAIRSGR